MRRIKRHIGFHHINTPEKIIFVLAVLALGAFGMSYSLKAYPETFKADVSQKNKSEIGFREPIIIDFSLPVLKKYYETGIKTEPAEKIKISWENSNRRIIISPETFWRPEMNYQIILPEGKSVMFSNILSQTINFSTEKYPVVAKIVPENNAQNVIIGMEDPLTIDFEKSTENFFLKFELNPENELSFQNNVNKTQFKLLSKNGLENGQKYSIKIYAKCAGDADENYKQIYESAFETQAPAPLSAQKNYDLRLEQARKTTRAKIETGKYIDVNTSAQVLSTFENGKLLDSYMISSGKRGMETPKGETKIYNKFPRAFSRAYGLYMPYWMALAPSGKFGFHELPEWPNGYKEGQAHLGIPVSHGCVRLGVGPAEKIYNWAEIGTPVVIY